MSLCPADQRIQNWINDYLSDVDAPVPRLPERQLKLDRHGLSRVLSLPKGEDVHETSICKSYRVAQGIASCTNERTHAPTHSHTISVDIADCEPSLMVTLGVVHNPKSDKRTTKGVFHVVDDGLPISGDKKVVPLCVCVGVPGSVWSSVCISDVCLSAG